MLIDNVVLKRRESGSGESQGVDIRDGETAGQARARLKSGGISRRDALDLLGRAAADEILADWQPLSPWMKTACPSADVFREMCRRSPHLWNIVAYEREWETHPEYNDFLNESSPIYHKKKYQMDVYEELLAPEIGRLAEGARVLDVGGGVGRAAVRLLRRGLDVTIVDSSPRALTAAWGHLARVGEGSYDLAWADATDMSFIEDGSFDAALALEVFCYLEDPTAALAETVRCVRPGGWVAFSVENKPGAIFADSHLGLNNRMKLLFSSDVAIEDELYVKYISTPELMSMARKAGMRDVRIVGCHNIADGPLDAIAGEKAYKSAAAVRRLRAAERLLQRVPPFFSAARAKLVVGRV